MDQKLQAHEKKAYQQPHLKIYGDLLKLTGLVNNAGSVVDAMFGTLKTA
jgi:hypothetical protein